ncbi:DNA photolyase [Penicillium atrosanguineum]|uniref:DNA photolyase n=1 Tax=Penicillium atrosanguineum TaxID=1132637 RepID=A0A9W9PNS7_9EURO|nr:DNA photolyase [Penicillium atrosanguineum]KAJ5136712.1 DNA photolyase [Penicillium atrosanguineum]KAJ5302921.1 DNA photolyase [Penicillium atrosanguineum]
MKHKPTTPVVLYWHRTDLRLHDSPALTTALSLKPSVFIPIWTWDPHYVYHARVGPNRWRFLLDSQKDLSKSYTTLNPKQKLWVVREGPMTVLPKLWKAWGITHLVFEQDTDAYARDRDEGVMKLAEKEGIEVIVKVGRTLFDPDMLVRNNQGKPVVSMSQVEKAGDKINGGRPDRPIDAPGSVPDPWNEERMDLSGVEFGGVEVEGDLNAAYRVEEDRQYSRIMGPKGDFGIPTLEEIGIGEDQVEGPHRGGESVALKILAGYIEDEEYIGTFEKPNTSPAAFEPQSTTLLSPHLHFGSLSVRKFFWDVQDVFSKRKKEKKQNAPIPTNLPGQLLFREMYFAAQAALGYKFQRTYGNKMVRFIDWHLQSKTPEELEKEGPTAQPYHVDSPEAEEWFQRWREGRTGFPWIDALMRQLKQEGWIHHLGRHSVACFLTRGGCYVSWERGAEVFEEWLIDHEMASNIGNWMWLSCTAFYNQYYRCYSPISFGKKWDPQGDFVRKYCPELAKFDKKYIFEPWKAPIADQRKWGCRISGDGSVESKEKMQEQGEEQTYPKPMFDFDERRTFCMDAMKNAYSIGLHGDDREVLNGTWRKAFGIDEEPSKKKQKAK